MAEALHKHGFDLIVDAEMEVVAIVDSYRAPLLVRLINSYKCRTPDD